MLYQEGALVLECTISIHQIEHCSIADHQNNRHDHMTVSAEEVSLLDGAQVKNQTNIVGKSLLTFQRT